MTNDGNTKIDRGNYNENIQGNYIQKQVVKLRNLSLKYIGWTSLAITSLLSIVLVKYNSDSSVKTYGDSSPVIDNTGVRKQQSLRKVIDGGESAGAILTQLIIFNVI